MKNLITFWTAMLVLTIALSPAPAAAQTETSVTGAGGGIFPSGASYNGAPLDGLKFGFGVTISGACVGTAGEQPRMNGNIQSL
jgi:hypothetical protein